MTIHKTSTIASGVFFGSNNVSISNNVFVNVNCFLDGCERINLEEYVRIGPHVKILTGSHTINPDVIRRSGTSRPVNEKVNIKRGAWIGMGAIILPGITIAEGCVIAAGAVVTQTTEANGVYAGNPARRVKDLPVAN